MLAELALKRKLSKNAGVWVLELEVSLNATSMTRTLASPVTARGDLAGWRERFRDWNGPGSDPVFQGAGGTRSRGPSVETGAGGAAPGNVRGRAAGAVEAGAPANRASPPETIKRHANRTAALRIIVASLLAYRLEPIIKLYWII